MIWFNNNLNTPAKTNDPIPFHTRREREKRMNRTLIYGTLNFNRKTVESAAPNILTRNRKSFKTLLTSTANDEDLPHYLYFYLRWTEKKREYCTDVVTVTVIYIHFFYQIWFTSLQLHAVTLESLKKCYNVCERKKSTKKKQL